MPTAVTLSTIPPLLGKGEGAGDRKVNLDTVIREHDVALKAIAAKTPFDTGSGLFVTTQFGKNGAGALTLTGVKVGDKVVGVTQLTTTFADLTASYETTITVVNQIQQSSATDFSAVKIQFMIVRQS